MEYYKRKNIASLPILCSIFILYGKICFTVFTLFPNGSLLSFLYLLPLNIICPYIPPTLPLAVSTFFSISLIWTNLITKHRGESRIPNQRQGKIQPTCDIKKSTVVMQKWDKCQHRFGMKSGMRLRRRKIKKGKWRFFLSKTQKCFSSLLYPKGSHGRIIIYRAEF